MIPRCVWSLGVAIALGSAPALAERVDESVELPALTGEITLGDALAAALLGSPELASMASGVRAREAQTLQASARPNPELALEVEDFAGSGERRALGVSQTTLSVAQLVDLGARRSTRIRVAEIEADLASNDYEVRRVAVLADTTKAFLRVLALQERTELVRDLESVSRASLSAVVQHSGSRRPSRKIARALRSSGYSSKPCE